MELVTGKGEPAKNKLNKLYLSQVLSAFRKHLRKQGDTSLMREKLIARCELDELKRLVLKYRSDWPAVFSTNVRGEIWPFLQWGYTPARNREPVQGLCQILDEIAGDYLKLRSGGGRFF